MELPDADDHGDFPDSGFDATRQMQVRMLHGSERPGVETASHRARGAFLGSLALALPTLIVNHHGGTLAAFGMPIAPPLYARCSE